jgi:8-oxo-dGTP diphosphatase
MSSEDSFEELKPTPLVRVGVAAVVIKGMSALLGLRKGAHGANTWSFPGGHLEFGESFEAAASRELLEEADVTIDPERFYLLGLTNDHFEGEGKHYVTVFLVTEWKDDDGEPRILEPHKCVEWRWFHELPESLFLPVQNLFKGGSPEDKGHSVEVLVKAALTPFSQTYELFGESRR